jgi:hypothetical protein
VSTVRIVLWAALGLLVVSGAAYGLSAALQREQRTRETVTGPVRRIVVETETGDVGIRAGLTGDVVIDRHDTWLLEHPRLRTSLRDGTLWIRGTCGGLTSVLRCRTNVSIAAPPDIDVVVRTDTGDVDLRGLSGRAEVHTETGDIRTQRQDPITMRAYTDAGDIALDLFGQPARTEARSGAGNIGVVVPYGPYRVDARAPAGTVRVDGLIRDDLAPQAIDAQTDAGDVSVRAR